MTSMVRSALLSCCTAQTSSAACQSLPLHRIYNKSTLCTQAALPITTISEHDRRLLFGADRPRTQTAGVNQSPVETELLDELFERANPSNANNIVDLLHGFAAEKSEPYIRYVFVCL